VTYPPHDSPSLSVSESQHVSEQLRPIVAELNRLVDRLEQLANDEELPDAPGP
jgi:hypothetical protein